ncbi:hypothetical protein, partial [Geodermatophilus sp. DF01-2]|uniref:hypothetical protein n=1 Tax=Geodermatophilus sp. DF01-2 TaxID=2559610 RepID=UPI001ADD8B0E
ISARGPASRPTPVPLQRAAARTSAVRLGAGAPVRSAGSSGAEPVAVSGRAAERGRAGGRPAPGTVALPSPRPDREDTTP